LRLVKPAPGRGLSVNAPERPRRWPESPHGCRAAAGSYDTSLTVWDAQTGQKMFTLNGHSGIVTSVNFSQDGKWERQQQR